MKKTAHHVLLATLLTLASGQSFATVQDDAMTHFNAIANGKTAELRQQYAQNARLDWVGGALNGTYTTLDTIDGVWSKFTTAQGKLKYKIDYLNNAITPQGSTLITRVKFTGKTTINVLHVLTYREGKIVSEIWQTDPTEGLKP